MPRKRKEAFRKRRTWGEGHAFFLMCGLDFFGEAWGRLAGPDGFGRHISPEQLAEMAEAWEALREQVLERQRQHAGPFTRPWAFWMFEAPEPRRYRDGDTHDAPEEFWREHDGLPDYLGSGPAEDHPECESQRDYLLRLKLKLTEEEERLLRD